MTTDLKTVWLTKGTKVKNIAGSSEGYIGEVIDVLHLSVKGCIYKVVLNAFRPNLAQLYTQDQVVEYTQVEFCAGGAK